MTMLKGFPFKILSPKDIVSVLNVIGTHSTSTAESIERPLPENVMAFFSALAAFAYDMDSQQVKAQMPSDIPHLEVFDEATDFLTVFKLSRQLSMVNMIDDFTFKDIWEPGPKRTRALLSGMINFCRYKEAKSAVITGMKQDLQLLDASRVELVDELSKVEVQLAAAQEQHFAELPLVREAEAEVAEAKATTEKLARQRSAADRVVEDMEKKLEAVQGQVADQELRAQLLLDQVEGLQNQVAESPEDLEKEIKELQHGVQQQKAWLSERADERRSRLHRDQVLMRLSGHLETYRDDLVRLREAALAADAGTARGGAARAELAKMRKSLEALHQEDAELRESIQKITTDTERAKQAHAERLTQLEARHKVALEQHKELQAKHTEEQQRLHELQSRRLELERKVAAARRTQNLEMDELRGHKQAVQESANVFCQSLDALLVQHNSMGSSCAGSQGQGSGEMTSGPAKQPQRSPMASPDMVMRVLCSPSPARAAAERRLLMSPPPLPKGQAGR